MTTVHGDAPELISSGDDRGGFARSWIDRGEQRRSESIAFVALALAALALAVSLVRPGLDSFTSAAVAQQPQTVVDWYAMSWQEALGLAPAALRQHFEVG